MKFRPLQAGLMVEGPADEPYLKNLVQRQLDELILTRSRHTVHVLPCIVSDIRTTDAEETVLQEARDLSRDCDVLFVHGDADARDKTAKLVAALDERRTRQRRHACPVPVVTVLMTESWMLADRTALESVITGGPVKDYPYSRPADVEKRVTLPPGRERLTPKQVWKTLLGDQAHDALLDAAELLVRRTDLAVLRTVPSYRTWCGETERALRELRYL